MFKLNNSPIVGCVLLLLVAVVTLLNSQHVSCSGSLRDWLDSLQSEASTLQIKSNQLEKSISILMDSNSTFVQMRISQLAKIKKALESLNAEIQIINQACSTKGGPDCNVTCLNGLIGTDCVSTTSNLLGGYGMVVPSCDSKCLNCSITGQCLLCSGNWTGPTCSTCNIGWTGANCTTVDVRGDLVTSSILNSTMATRFVSDLISTVKTRATKLLYRASRDNFTCVNNLAPTNFQTQISNKGPTFVIFKGTSGSIFGGYTSKHLTTSCTQTSDAAAFIFSIQSETGQQRFTKFPVINTAQAILPCSNAFIAFGNGIDLFYGCYDYALIGRTMPSSYSTTMGQYYLTGSYVPYSNIGSTFSVSDFEVYSL